MTYLRTCHAARGILETEKEPLADFHVDKYAEVGPKKIAADFGMKVNLDRASTREEWLEALQREGMSRIWSDLNSPTEA